VRFALPVLLAATLLAGCSGGTSRPAVPTIGKARWYTLQGFQPSGTVSAGPTTLSFTIDKPSGGRLVAYRRGPGPHTGIHLIIVRDDLSEIIHKHPPVQPGGLIEQRVDFPKPGRYHVLVDAYPKQGPPPNFQLTRDVQVGSTDKQEPVPPFRPTVVTDGYRVTLTGVPKLRAARPAFITAHVTDPQGRPAHFVPYYGALAHAIFFRAGSLDYFHTHICGPNTPGCTGVLGNPSLNAQTTKPGKLRLGLLLPIAGTWRLFLQFLSDGKFHTAPFTLKVG
jgi:hypothetical protein